MADSRDEVEFLLAKAAQLRTIAQNCPRTLREKLVAMARELEERADGLDGSDLEQ
jgi:hypothetical protein